MFQIRASCLRFISFRLNGSIYLLTGNIFTVQGGEYVGLSLPTELFLMHFLFAAVVFVFELDHRHCDRIRSM